MKLTLRRIIFTAFAAIVFLSLTVIASFSSHGATVKAGLHTGSKNNDSIFIQKKVISKFHKIGLYPDATRKVVFFTVRGERGKVYQLYVFDLEGNLIRQREIRNEQTTFINDIEKGIYLFDVFCDDDKIGNGQIAVR